MGMVVLVAGAALWAVLVAVVYCLLAHRGRRRDVSLLHRHGRRPCCWAPRSCASQPSHRTRTRPDLTRVNPGAICVTARGYHEAMTATPEVDVPDTGTIRNPATGAVAGKVRWTDPADVPRIAPGCARRRREWEARGAKGRAKVLARYAVWLGEHRDEIETLLIKETGKSATDAAQEVPLLIMIASYYIKTMEKALAPEPRPASLPFLAIKKVTVHYRPRPVVGIIAPWNYPVANALMDAIGALAAGCAVLLKPSERTPLTAELLLRGWLDSGAPEVLALAQGAREVSEAVIDNSDFIQFTGSSATGAKVMERAARRLTPVSLELGGKDPMIVLEDADVDLAAHAAVWGAMFNAGQTCVSVERVYVLEPVYDQFVAAVVRDVKNLKMGAGDGLRLRLADRRRARSR